MYRRCTVFKRSMSSLTHVDSISNTPKMVDVSAKATSLRLAHARAIVYLPIEVSRLIGKKEHSTGHEIVGSKGPVFSTAIVAGVLAAKKTSELIPFCHPIPLEDCSIKIDVDEKDSQLVVIDCIAKTSSKTGVEMEALVGATNAALCIYDMLKAVSHDIQITNVCLMAKSGGKSDVKRQSKTNPFVESSPLA